MFWSMAPLVLACIVLAGMVGMCSFQPAGPSTGAPPSYDVVDALKSDAQTVGFPVRIPNLPDGWHANSGRREGLDAGRTDPVTGQPVRALISEVGYLTPNGMWVSLTQSNADEDKLVASISGGLYAAGTQDIGGRRWIVYQGGDGVEPVWTTRVGSAPGGSTQLAITGAGSPDEFRTLATATQTQPPLPAR